VQTIVCTAIKRKHGTLADFEEGHLRGNIERIDDYIASCSTGKRGASWNSIAGSMTINAKQLSD